MYVPFSSCTGHYILHAGDEHMSIILSSVALLDCLPDLNLKPALVALHPSPPTGDAISPPVLRSYEAMIRFCAAHAANDTALAGLAMQHVLTGVLSGVPR
jgi:hypothetical protein